MVRIPINSPRFTQGGLFLFLVETGPAPVRVDPVRAHQDLPSGRPLSRGSEEGSMFDRLLGDDRSLGESIRLHAASKPTADLARRPFTRRRALKT